MEKSKNSFELYSNRILSLAADIPLMERLETPDITVTKRSKLCGSMVTIDLVMKSKVIIAYSHDIKACALGQASASILAKDIIGKTGDQIVTVRDSVVKMLSGSIYLPNIFTDYQVLSPASQFTNRHDSILLALNATVEAIATIATTTKH